MHGLIIVCAWSHYCCVDASRIYIWSSMCLFCIIYQSFLHTVFFLHVQMYITYRCASVRIDWKLTTNAYFCDTHSFLLSNNQSINKYRIFICFLFWYFVDSNKNELVILKSSIYNTSLILDIKCIRLNRNFLYIIN